MTKILNMIPSPPIAPACLLGRFGPCFGIAFYAREESSESKFLIQIEQEVGGFAIIAQIRSLSLGGNNKDRCDAAPAVCRVHPYLPYLM